MIFSHDCVRLFASVLEQLMSDGQEWQRQARAEEHREEGRQHIAILDWEWQVVSGNTAVIAAHWGLDESLGQFQ